MHLPISALLCIFFLANLPFVSPKFRRPNSTTRRLPSFRRTTDKKQITVGGIFHPLDKLPGSHDYFRACKAQLSEALSRYGDLTPFRQYYDFTKFVDSTATMFTGARDPMHVVNTLCYKMIPKQVAVILYFSTYEKYDQSTAFSQYLLHMTSYTGIPIIAWNADNSGLLVDRALNKYRILQIAPPIEHQVQAMVKLLEEHRWSRFVVVTTHIAGYQYFLNLLRQRAHGHGSKQQFKLELVDEFLVNPKNSSSITHEMQRLSKGDDRIILLYATHDEANKIFTVARQLGLTNEDYLWIATQSVVTNAQMDKMHPFQVGMLAIHFNTKTVVSYQRVAGKMEKTDATGNAISNAVDILAAGLNLLVADHNGTFNLSSESSCETDINYTWPTGAVLYNYLLRASITVDTGDPRYPKTQLSFDDSGKLKQSYLTILNLKADHVWEKVGYYTNGHLGMYGITWPGGKASPPKGSPDRYHMTIVTLDESPFLFANDMPAQSDECPTNQVPCRWSFKNDFELKNLTSQDPEFWHRNTSTYKCCSGFCVDLLKKLSTDIGFSFDLYKVQDGKWGIKQNGKWNGLMAELVNRQADMCATALKINSDRQMDIDFSVPFHETGISILVAKRRGALSPTAFLEPFEYNTWIFVLIISIQASAFAIFGFEWLSPQSYNMGKQPPPGHKFSLFRSYWLVWATFFSTSVNTDVPRSHTARFMVLVWSAFSMTFLAVYTANLAAFMITRTEFHDLTGIDDPKITNPRDLTPPFTYGTVISGNTEETLRKNYQNLYSYMAKDNQFFKQNVSEGVLAVKKGEYNAFLYDAVVLEYLTGKDDYCEILTVGKWFSISGYGMGFPKNSKWLEKINKYVLLYQERGELERLQNFWFSGTCAQKGTDRSTMSHSLPLGVENFVSVFGLLAGGTMLGLAVLLFEYIYCKYLRQKMATCDKRGWCALISLSLGRSLSSDNITDKSSRNRKQEILKNEKLKRLQTLCHKTELDYAYNTIAELEKQLAIMKKNSKKCTCTQPRNLDYVIDDGNSTRSSLDDIHLCEQFLTITSTREGSFETDI